MLSTRCLCEQGVCHLPSCTAADFVVQGTWNNILLTGKLIPKASLRPFLNCHQMVFFFLIDLFFAVCYSSCLPHKVAKRAMFCMGNCMFCTLLFSAETKLGCPRLWLQEPSHSTAHHAQCMHPYSLSSVWWSECRAHLIWDGNLELMFIESSTPYWEGTLSPHTSSFSHHFLRDLKSPKPMKGCTNRCL